jgi:hypothetical protein
VKGDVGCGVWERARATLHSRIAFNVHHHQWI